MKKKILLPFLMLFIVFLASCSKTEQDPYKSFRGYSSQKIFEDGEKALASKDYDSAIKHFEALDALYPFGPNGQQGQLDIIYAYYKAGDNASAIAAADRYVRLYPQSPHLDYAYYMRGVVGFGLGLSWLQKKVGIDPGTRDIANLQQSFSAFATLVQNFPNSIYTPDAIRRMRYIRNQLAEREVLIARFYMERKAYVAATNRASNVVLHFQGAPAVVEALAIMVEGYRALGLTAMADSSYRILQENYPSSGEFRSLKP